MLINYTTPTYKLASVKGVEPSLHSLKTNCPRPVRRHRHKISWVFGSRTHRFYVHTLNPLQLCLENLKSKDNMNFIMVLYERIVGDTFQAFTLSNRFIPAC